MLDLIRRHGTDAVERACALAVSAGVWRLRFLRTVLALQSPTAELTVSHRIIPTTDTYAKHFAARTQGELHFDN